MTLSKLEDEEMDYVEELQKRFKGVMNKDMHDDRAMFIRFLRARNYDLKAAENMLRNHINWRKLNKVDTILDWYKPSEVATQYIIFNRIGKDKEGSPVLYVNFGNMDTRGLYRSLPYNQIQDHCVHRLESDILDLRIESEKRKKNVDQMVFIMDFENFPLSVATHKPTLEYVSKLVTMYESNYPERMKRAFLINASWYFTIAFAVIKPILTGPTLQKIRLLGKSDYKEELLSYIDEEELPAFLGGTKTDPDGNPMCRSIIPEGGLIPEKYFAVDSKSAFLKKPGLKKITISRLSKTVIDITVIKPGADLEWEFEVKGRDIGFSLLYKKNATDEDSDEIMPKQKIDTTVSTEAGLYKCEKPGLYMLHFDNTYSWIHQKEVYYRIQVVNPC